MADQQALQMPAHASTAPARSGSYAIVRDGQVADDPVVATYFEAMWRETLASDTCLRADSADAVREFLDQNRRSASLKTFVAEVDGQPVGCAACQLFRGLYPLVLKDSVRLYGYVWGLYVQPEHRRKGIARKLLSSCHEHLQELRCTKILLHASPAGRPLYEGEGYSAHNEMALVLDK